MTTIDSTQFVADPANQTLEMIREFNAPRDLVFQAFTDAEMIQHWIGPRRLTMKLDRFEPHNGGSWRYVHIDPSGAEFGFHGVFHEVLAPERLIQTFEFEGAPGTFVNLEIALFEELPGNRTLYTGKTVFQSAEVRDGALQSGMEAGMRESYQRLEELLEKVQL